MTEEMKDNTEEFFNMDGADPSEGDMPEEDIVEAEVTEEEPEYIPMSLNQYQYAASKTSVFTEEQMPEFFMYCAFGLPGEVGEYVEKIAKQYRDGADERTLNDDLANELGDILWFVAMNAACLGYDLENIAMRNLMKLAKREVDGTLRGGGDDR